MRNTIYAIVLICIGLFSCKKQTANAPEANEPQLSPTTLGTQAVISVTMSAAKDILTDGYGFNTRFPEVYEPYTSNNFFWRNAVSATKASCIRYPGGTVGNFWSGAPTILFSKKSTADPNGWIDANKIFSSLIYDAITANNQKKNSLADVKQVVDATNCSVFFVLNMITPGEDFYESPQGWNRTVNAHPPSTTNYTTPQTDDWYKMLDNRYNRTKQILVHAKAQNIPIKYIELGNECYLALCSYYTDVFPRGEDYAIAVNYFVNKLKNDAGLNLGPNVRYAVAGVAEQKSYTSPRINNWNSQMISKLNNSITDVVLHSYQDADMNLTNYNSASDLYGNISKWNTDFNAALTNHGTQSLILANSSRFNVWWNELSPGQTSFPVMKKWGSVMTQLYAALWSLDNKGMNYMKPNLDASLVIDPSTGNLNQQGAAFEPFMLAIKNSDTARKLNFAGLANIGTTGKTIVQGYSFTNNGSNKKSCIVNFSNQTINIDLSNVFPSNSQLTVSGVKNNLNSNTVPTSIDVHTNPTTNVILQPYSVNFIRP